MSQSATGHPEDRDPADRPLRRSLLLIGLMGVGKTTIARVLARRLKTRMIDTDTEIERRARSTVAQIFAEQGEEQFRLMETDLLRHLDRRRHVRIVSTGGGLPLRPENQALLRRIGTVIWLRARPETIERRVRARLWRRPLLAAHGDDLRARIDQLILERESVYEALAHAVYDSERFAHSDAIADAIVERYGWPVS